MPLQNSQEATKKSKIAGSQARKESRKRAMTGYKAGISRLQIELSVTWGQFS